MAVYRKGEGHGGRDMVIPGERVQRNRSVSLSYISPISGYNCMTLLLINLDNACFTDAVFCSTCN